jgi:hypothetical protein
MSRTFAIALCLATFAGASFAQSAPPQAADQFGPARSSTAAAARDAYNNSRAPRAGEADSHFKFRDNKPAQLGDPYPDRRPFEKAGQPPTAQDGRPPVQCAQTPMDPACR